MPTFNRRLPKIDQYKEYLNKSGGKPYSKLMKQRQDMAQTMHGFDKTNIVDTFIKPLGVTTYYGAGYIQKFYVFYKKAAGDKVVKINISPYNVNTSFDTSYNVNYKFYVDIKEITTYTLASDMKWTNGINGLNKPFDSAASGNTRSMYPGNNQNPIITYEDCLDVSSWTTNTVYCFEIISYPITPVPVPEPLPNMFGIGRIHFSVNPVDSGAYLTATGIDQDSLSVGRDIVKTYTDTISNRTSGITTMLSEIEVVKNSSYDHAQCLLQDLQESAKATYELGYETYIIPAENFSFADAAIPLLMIHSPRMQKTSSGNKVFQFCMKYVPSVSVPANHTFDLEYRARTRTSSYSYINSWTNLKTFSIPDSGVVFTDDFNLPGSVSGYPSDTITFEFRLLGSDTANPYKIQNISIIEKQYS